MIKNKLTLRIFTMLNRILILSICILFMNSCSNQSNEVWRDLFNGKDLSGWETYIGPLYSEIKKDFDGTHVGLNNDPRHVFSVVTEDGEPALRISGEEFGGISTVDSFSNYHLQLQFKWGEAKYKPRDNAKRDSGILYHARGPHAAEWFFWMKSQEFQVQEGDCGDYWGLGSDMDIRAVMNEDSTYSYNPEAKPKHFGRHSPNRTAKKSPDGLENAHGEWNTLDLYTTGQTSMHFVNGTLVMVLENSREISGEHENPVTAGKIQIQSEGAEVFYRNIRLKTIKSLPPISKS
jgi:hypothetical protein